ATNRAARGGYEAQVTQWRITTFFISPVYCVRVKTVWSRQFPFRSRNPNVQRLTLATHSKMPDGPVLGESLLDYASPEWRARTRILAGSTGVGQFWESVADCRAATSVILAIRFSYFGHSLRRFDIHLQTE